jgi:hypothetical protein
MTLGHVFPNHVHFLWICVRVNEVLAQRQPQVSQHDTGRTGLLATSAERAAINGFTELLELLPGGCSPAKESSQQARPRTHKFAQLKKAIYTG